MVHTSNSLFSTATVQQTEELPTLNMRFSQLLEQQIATYPHADTFESSTENLKWTTREVYKMMRSLTAGLFEMKARGGRPVSYTAAAPIRAEVFAGLLAAPDSGKLFASIPPLRHAQMLQDAKSTNAMIFLFCPKVGKVLQPDAIYEYFHHLQMVVPPAYLPINDKRVPDLQFIVHTAKKMLPGMVDHKQLCVTGFYNDDLIRYKKPADDPSSLIATQQSLNDPSATQLVLAALSQNNLINTANSVGHAIGLSQSHASLNLVQPYFAGGQSVGLIMPVVRRSKIVFATDVPESDLTKVHKAVPLHGVNVVIGDEGIWKKILKESTKEQMSDFKSKVQKAIVVSQKPLESAFLKDLASSLESNAKIHTVYGSENTSGAVLVDGKPIANTQVQIVDAKSTANKLQSSSKGVLAVKGVNVFKGYWKDGQLDTSSISNDGWVVTDIPAQAGPNGTFSVSL